MRPRWLWLVPKSIRPAVIRWLRRRGWRLTWRATKPCPRCGQGFVLGMILIKANGEHGHTKYVCAVWGCGWSGWSVPGWDGAEAVPDCGTASWYLADKLDQWQWEHPFVVKAVWAADLAEPLPEPPCTVDGVTIHHADRVLVPSIGVVERVAGAWVVTFSPEASARVRMPVAVRDGITSYDSYWVPSPSDDFRGFSVVASMPSHGRMPSNVVSGWGRS